MSKQIYLEWLIPVCDYFEVLKKNERRLEIGVPLLLSILSLGLCMFANLEVIAVKNMNSLLPNVLAILIGFSISAIAIIVTTNGKNSAMSSEMERTVEKRLISFQQWMLINLIYYLFCEILFLIITFAFPLLLKIWQIHFLWRCALAIYVYFLTRILLGLVKVTTQLYFVYFKDTHPE